MRNYLPVALLAALVLTVGGCASSGDSGPVTPRGVPDAVAAAAPPAAPAQREVPPPAAVPEPTATTAVAPARPSPTPPPPDAAAPRRAGSSPAATPRPAAARVPPAPAPAKPAVATQSLAGRLDLVAGAGGKVAAGEAADGLVYFVPKGGAPVPRPGTFSIDTRSKGFLPSVMVVPVGSTVRFPNRDTILHNVFSRTPGNSFDLGYYGPGQSRQAVFAKPGRVIVNCNVHHNMRADVVVLATPYYVRPDRSGRFELKGVPPGSGTLVYWHPRADAQSVPVTLPTSTQQVRRLVAVRPALAGMQGR